MRSLAVVLLVVGLSSSSFGQSLKEEEEAPGFVLKSLSNQTVRLRDYKGKLVLLNFWATWCPPCKAEMPEMVKWQAQYKTQGLQIIGVTFPPYKLGTVRQISKTLRLNYPVVLDDKKLARSYVVSEILPVTIVIDRQGKIVARILGIIDSEEFEQKVKPLLEGSVPSK
jgi:peroxiredoxin